MSSAFKALWSQTKQLLFSSTDRMTVDTEDIESRPATHTDQVQIADEGKDSKHAEKKSERMPIIVPLMRSPRASSFPLFKLPGEIRNRVYEFCLVPRNTDGSLKPVSPYQPALTRVNRVLRGETLNLFYASNRFELFIHIINTEIDVPGQLNQHMRLLRGIRNVAQNGHFQLMNELTVHLVTDPDAYYSGISGGRWVLRARLLKKDPQILRSPIVRDYLLAEDSFYELDRLGAGDIDWRNEDSVHHAVESQKARFSDEFVANGQFELSIDVEDIPCCQLCQLLYALLGNSSIIDYSGRCLFFDIYVQ